MRKNKKLILISSILATTAIAVVPVLSIVNTVNTAKVSDHQLDSIGQNSERLEVESIDTVGDSNQVKAVDDQFTVDADALMAAGWGTDITGGLLFTIIKETDAEKNVSMQAENTEEFAATNLSIKNTITNAGIVYNVTEIVGDGFNDCHGLTSVTIGGGVTLIDFSAFANCVGLTSVTINSGVETIAQSAFSGCKNLTGTLTIPASVTSIGEDAFTYGSHFTSIDISSTNTTFVKAINVGANCHAIIDVSTAGIFNSDSKIIGGLICGELELQNGLLSVAKQAFENCSGLTGVIFPASVTTIGDRAFAGCARLTSVTIGDGVDSIGNYAFSDCPLSTIDLTTNTNFIRANNLGANCQVILESDSGGTFSNSSLVVAGLACGEMDFTNSGVTLITNNVFSWCPGLTSVIISTDSQVTSIGDEAFRNCSGLTSLNLTGATSLETIGMSSFSDCSGLTGALTIPASVTTISYGAFERCSKLNSLDLSNAASLQTFGNYAFENCIGLTGTLTIPSSVTSIGANAFNGCAGLASLNLTGATSFQTIGNSAFSNCKGLASTLTIPASVTSIGVGAFEMCSKLPGLDLSKATSLQTINNYTFYSCPSLTGTLTIPASVTTIGDGAFGYCSGLTGTLTIPAGVTSIGANAFESCTRLTGTLTIPASVVSIGNEAFNKNAFQDFKFLSENRPAALGINIFGKGVKKTLWVSSLNAQNNYSPYAVTNFGLVSAEYVKITPASIDISLTGVSPFTIDLNQAKETIITTATVAANPVDASVQEVTWSLVDNPNWLVIDSTGNITANEDLKTASPGPYSFKVEVVCKAAGQTFKKITDAIPINVIYPSISSITIDPIASVNITLGEQANPNLRQCTAKIQPENYDPTRIKWSITGDKPNWLEINSLTGMISTNQSVTTAMPDSKDYTIQLETLDSPVLIAAQSFTVNFTKPAPTDIAINGVNTSQTVKVNETLTLNPTATITPAYASTDVAWSLSDTHPSDMIIDPATGKITFAAAMKHANNTYNFDIIAKSTAAGSLIQGTFSVQLKVDYAIVTSVTVGDIETFDLELGQDVAHLVTCTATVNPNPGTSQVVTWSIVSGPSWISINANSGAISVAGATDESLIGAQTITVKAISQQDTGQSGDKDFTINFTKHISTNDLNLGAIIGGTIGGAVGVAAIAGATTYYIKRNKKLENK